jgi:hypothetical protein
MHRAKTRAGRAPGDLQPEHAQDPVPAQAMPWLARGIVTHS